MGIDGSPMARSMRAELARLRAQAAAGAIDTWWELDLLTWFHIPLPEPAALRLRSRLEAAVSETEYPAGEGPWQSVTRGRALYAIENASHLIECVTKTGGVSAATHDKLVRWLRSLERADGRFAAEDEYERLERITRPEDARRRSDEARRSWQLAVPDLDPPLEVAPHSELADACHAVDALRRLGEDPSAATVSWVQGRQCGDGAFRSPLTIDPSGAPHGTDLAATAAALRALSLSSATPVDVEGCTAWLLRESERIRLTDLTRWLQLVSALHELAAVGRLRIDLAAAVARQEIEETQPDRVDFELYAVVRIVQLLDAARRVS